MTKPDPTTPSAESEGKHAQATAPKPRVKRPNRNQMELVSITLDGTIPAEHEVRLIWEFVEHVDLTPWYAAIRAVEGRAGRDAIDPAILFALWLYATLQGVGSARKLGHLCEEHDAYRWLCGGVSVNYHTLADFRVAHDDWMNDLLTKSVAALITDGLVTMRRVSQDGKHVRASAGSSSFRRREKLEEHLQKARNQVEALRKELESDPQANSKREQAARQRAVKEREQRVTKALDRLKEIEKPQPSSPKKSDPTQTTSKGKRKREPRASTTDAEARVMMMADGGFRPAYDVQFTTDTETLIIGGMIVSNQGNDKGMVTRMQQQYQERYGYYPQEVLVDGGFVDYKDFEQVTQQGTIIYAPPANYRSNEPDPYQPQANDTPTIEEWRKRMATEAAKEIYKLRASTAECINAICTNRGLTQFVVRGSKKVRAVVLWYAILHNLMRGRTLRLGVG
jgi:transposase